jgi:hypothetical protein
MGRGPGLRDAIRNAACMFLGSRFIQQVSCAAEITNFSVSSLEGCAP